MADNTFEQPIVVPFVPRDQGMVATPLPQFEDTRLSVSNAVNRNADYEAELLRLSEKTGVPMDSIRTHPDPVKQRERFNALDLDKLEAQYPTTYKFLANQQNADVSHDDTSTLGRVESAFNSFKRGVEKGGIQDELGDLNYKAFTGTITPIEQARRDKLKGDMGYIERQQDKTSSAIDYFTHQTGYTGRQMVSSIREGAIGGLQGATAGAVAATIAGQIGPQVALPEEVFTVPGAAAWAGRAGFIASSVMYNYKMESGFAFDEFSDLRDQAGQPLSRDVVQGAAAAVGLVNAGLETVGEMAMLKLFPGADKLLAAGPKEFVKQMLTRPTVRAALANAGKKWVQAASVEGFTEAIQELSTIFGREIAEGVSDQTFAPTPLADDAKRVGQAGADAFVGSLGVGAPATGYRGYRDVRQAQQMEQNQQFIQALGEDATESKLQTRLPEKFKEFVARAKEGGAIDNIYIPAEQFQQFFQTQGADPSEVAAQVGATNYSEALAAGTDVVIPIENYASSIAATPLHQGLAQDIRLRQGEMTAREYAEYQMEKEAHAKGIEEDLARLSAENGQQDYRSALQGIITDIEGQLIAAGTERSTAAAQAEAMRPFATMIYRDMLGRAERDGVQVSEQEVHDQIMRLWSQYGLNVSRPLPDILTQNLQSDISIDPMIDMLRSGQGIPTDSQMRGESLLPFIKKIGGIRPGYGELKDADVGAKRKDEFIVRENGRALDEIGALAVEAGYFQPDANGSVDETTLLNAIAGELGGSPTYSVQNENAQAIQLAQALEQLDQYLSQLGIDLKAVTDNAAVRKMIEQAMSDPNVQEQVQQLFQQVIEQGTPQTIVVDGVERPTRNSEGRVIANSPEAMANFWRWFGDSKVVDAEGRPQVMYHGTSDRFTTFDMNREAKRWTTFSEQDVKTSGAFFTPSKDDAESYGDNVMAVYLRVGKRFGELASYSSQSTPEQKAEIEKQYKDAEYILEPATYNNEVDGRKVIDTDNGMSSIDVDADGEWLDTVLFKNGDMDWSYLDNPEVVARMKERGYDGAKVYEPNDQSGESWFVTSPEQIKSATGNNGQFDPNNPSILFQSAWHGSPHRHSKFLTDHIGTGEGAQAFGWGLYFASKREIAEWYRDNLSSRQGADPTNEKLDGKTLMEWYAYWESKAIKASDPTPFYDRMSMLENAELKWNPQSALNDAIEEGASQEAIDWFKSTIADKFDRPGATYEVSIPEDDVMLLWDKPLSEQPEKVKAALESNRARIEQRLRTDLGMTLDDYLNDNGDNFYFALSNGLGGDEQASRFLNELGISGIKYLDNTSRDGAQADGSYNYVVFDDNAVEILNTYYQKDNGDKQGYIQFGADRTFNIALLEKADLSTFLHETGHFWLEVMGDLASDPQASDQIKGDYAAILNWMGAESRDQIGVEQHELFARANEAYLMEGNAPSAELRGVFQRFRSWLQLIYKQLSALNVKLNDEVRGVFDRMYATDQQIEDAKRDVDMQPLLLDAATAGMSEQEFALYRKDVAEATASAKDALQAKLMREYQREQQAWWKEALTAMKAEVAAEVDERPVYKAFAALTAGEIDGIAIKLNKEALVEKYGAEYVKRLPRKFALIYTTKGGMDADAAATYLGFESGDALVEALVSMRPRNELIAAEADVRMRETYGDMMTDGSIADEARVALHNGQRERVLMTELRALRRRQADVQPFVQAERQKAAGERRAARAATQVPPVSMFRDAARGLIGQTAVRNIQPYRYLQAERKAARAAFEAMAKGDYMLAADAKQKELLNHYLYLEATKAKEDADATLKYMRRFESGTTREQMGKAGADYLDQIDALLDRYEFRRVPLRSLERRKALALWAAEQEAQGNEVAVDPVLLDEARRVNYREVPVDELRAVRDAVKNIEHLARLKNKLITKGNQAEFADAVAELVASAENNGTRKAVPLDMSAMTMGERAGDTVSRLDAMLLKMEQVVMWLDGNNVTGPWHTYLWNPIAEAQVAENDLTMQLTAKLAEALEAMPKKQRESMLDTFEIPGMGKVTRKFIVSIGMNMGNSQNIDKMMRGFGWDMGVIEGALAKLNADDLAFIQQTLDTIGGLWPQIAELEKRMTGLEPPKVETAPFDVRDDQGNVIGKIEGYFPLVYDPRKSEQGAKQETGNLGQLFEEGYVRATTPKGHTKARTEGFAAPLLLDFEQVVTQHMAKVVKDLTHREAIVAANKILTNPEIRNVLQETLGTAYEKQMLPWLRSVVNDKNGGSTQGLTDFSRWMMTARANVVAATMGFKATTAIMQVTGLSQSLDMVKPKYLGQALLEFLRHPVALTNQVRELSGEMRHRSNMLDRDMRDQLRNLTGQNSTWAQAQKFAFHGIAIADAMVSVPTWMGAYKQALDAGASEEAARLEADAAVRLTQGSGGQKDLAAIQRNNELAKTLTMFYSYFSALYNRMRDMGRDVQEVRDMPRFLARVFFTVMIPAVAADLIVGRGPGDDEDWAAWLARKMLLYPLMSVPLLRDIAGSLDSGFDYKFSPIASGFEKLAKLTTSIGKVIEGDMEWPDFALKAADTIGYVFGVAGTAQLMATGKYLWRVSEGEESPDNLAELIGYAIVGKRKE